MTRPRRRRHDAPPGPAALQRRSLRRHGPVRRSVPWSSRPRCTATGWLLPRGRAAPGAAAATSSPAPSRAALRRGRWPAPSTRGGTSWAGPTRASWSRPAPAAGRWPGHPGRRAGLPDRAALRRWSSGRRACARPSAGCWPLEYPAQVLGPWPPRAPPTPTTTRRHRRPGAGPLRHLARPSCPPVRCRGGAGQRAARQPALRPLDTATGGGRRSGSARPTAATAGRGAGAGRPRPGRRSRPARAPAAAAGRPRAAAAGRRGLAAPTRSACSSGAGRRRRLRRHHRRAGRPTLDRLAADLPPATNRAARPSRRPAPGHHLRGGHRPAGRASAGRPWTAARPSGSAVDGIDELVDAARRVWRRRAGLGDLEAMRARSRVSEADGADRPRPASARSASSNGVGYPPPAPQASDAAAGGPRLGPTGQCRPSPEGVAVYGHG